MYADLILVIFVTEKTIVAELLPTSMDKAEKNRVFKNRESILTKVKEFIDEFFKPSDKVRYRPDMTVDDVLHYLITKVNITIVFQ